MSNKTESNPTNTNIQTTAKNLIIPLSFLLPVLILYILYPDSFQFEWKGRAPYLVFLWILSLELIIIGKNLPKPPLNTKQWTKTTAIAITIALPTLYVISTNTLQITNQIIEIGNVLGAGKYGEWFLKYSWPLSLEYLFFSGCLALSLWLFYGTNGFQRFSISLFFIGATGAFYMIDTFYPYASFGALQAMVPLTTESAAQFLKLMGYEAFVLPNHIYISALRLNQPMPILTVTSLSSYFQVGVFWPSSGIHSLFIYTFTILLFLKNTTISLTRKTIYMLIGAVGTFFVNVLRIASICIIGLNTGAQAADLFHTYFGEFYFITWIIIFPLTITYGPKILTKLSLKFKSNKQRQLTQTKIA
jgi:thaumarchaeosortase